MATPMKPLVQGGSYYPSRVWTPFVRGNGFTTQDGGEEQGVPKTVSGALIHILDALAAPVRALSVSINPVQDLHGQSYPWPAGGGVNLLPPMVDGTYEGNGVKAVVKDGIATLSGTTTSSGNALIIPLSKTWTAPASFYYHLGNSSVNTSLAPTIENSSSPGTSTISPSCSPVNRIAGPYTNYGGITYNRIRFYLAKNITVSGTYAPMMCLDNTARSYIPYSNICPISGWTQAKIWREVTHDTSANPTLTIDLDGTIYGGTLDVLTGVLTVDRASKPMNEMTWVYDATNTRFYSTSIVGQIKKGTSGWLTDLLCSAYSPANGVSQNGTISEYASTGYIYCKDTAYTDATLFSTSLVGQTLVYPLATTLTYQLTPTEVSTLAGENNVWADTGDTTMTYMAQGG